MSTKAEILSALRELKDRNVGTIQSADYEKMSDFLKGMIQGRVNAYSAAIAIIISLDN